MPTLNQIEISKILLYFGVGYPNNRYVLQCEMKLKSCNFRNFRNSLVVLMV